MSSSSKKQRGNSPVKRAETQQSRSSQVGSFGEKLKREREMRAITLEEIAEATKIGTRSLKALEEEHFDQLPGGIFNKGFVRAYAKFLGIDEEQAVADYVAATGDVGNSTSTQMAALADQVEQQRAAKEASDAGTDTGKMLAIIVAVVLICGIGFGGYKAWRYRVQQQEVHAAEAAAIRVKQSPPPVTVPADSASMNTNVAGTTPDAASPAGTTGASSATATSAQASSVQSSNTAAPSPNASTAATDFPINVTVKPLKPYWIMVTSEGKVVYQRMITPKDQELSVHGREKLQLILGNAAGVEVSFNGKSLGELVTEGHRREVIITPSGLER